MAELSAEDEAVHEAGTPARSWLDLALFCAVGLAAALVELFFANLSGEKSRHLHNALTGKSVRDPLTGGSGGFSWSSTGTLSGPFGPGGPYLGWRSGCSSCSRYF